MDLTAAVVGKAWWLQTHTGGVSMRKTPPQIPQNPSTLQSTPKYRYNVTVERTGEKLVFEHYADGQLQINGMICGWSEEMLGAEQLRFLVKMELAARKTP